MSSGTAVIPPTKSPKRRSKPKKTGPTVSDLIVKSLSASKERNGISLAALKKALQNSGYDVVKNKSRILIAIRRLLATKSLVQTKGTGAAGSFKLNKKPPTPRKKKVVKKKAATRAKKAKKATAKKATDAAPAAKKSPKKKRKASPKKAKRPAAAKKPKSPRKAKRSVAKSTRTRSADKK
ncbi:histone H1 [Polymixia lowei]